MKDKTQEFLQKLKDSGSWNDDYAYSKVEYTGIDNKVIIIDELGHEHSVTAYNVSKCYRLSPLSVVDKNRYFATRSKILHNDKYDYSKVDYIRNNVNVIIICKEHGEFGQTPANHLRNNGCPKCSNDVSGDARKSNTVEFIIKAKIIHGDKYNYAETKYIKAKTKLKIICSTHGEFEQIAQSHLSGSGCPVCSNNKQLSNENFIIRVKKVHGDKYDYSKVNYVNNHDKIIVVYNGFEHLVTPASILRGELITKSIIDKTGYYIREYNKIHGDKYDYSLFKYVNSQSNIKIICPEHGVFEQRPTHHLSGSGCIKCGGRYSPNTNEVITQFNKIHENKYDYSSVEYINDRTIINIICAVHGLFTQTPSNHKRGQGCLKCSQGYSKTVKINLINQLVESDLLTMDPFEIYTIISQGKLPVDFQALVHTDAVSDERIVTLRELRDQLSNEAEESSDGILNTIIDDNTTEFTEIDAVDSEITSNRTNEQRLPSINVTCDLHSLDNSLYTSMDEEAFESLIQYKLRKLWNNILNNDITIDSLKNENGGKYFTMIKDMFLNEYNEIIGYEPKGNYQFKFKPNLMQKLTVSRLIKNKSYGNWSGTGAGKTLSFIIGSREVESKLTLIIALNSTIKQTCNVIKEVYPDSKCFTEYNKGYLFDRNDNNYLVLNYEKFQQEYSEELFQDLTNTNQIDFLVIDEVHNAKQREEEHESIRRGVMNRLLGRIRENNDNIYTLVMSATPVVNNLYEAKSLLSLMTGLEYNDLQTRRTLPNALKVFQQLILNGLRYIPKYDIDMSELTGNNMSNLNIDGQHLLDELLTLPSNNYIASEKLLLNDKLNTITPYLRKGVIIYSYFTTGFITEIETYVKSMGYSVGTYTGEESVTFRENNLNSFINGGIDILIGSRPIGTGVDGLQDICNRMILITLPWTDSEYTQLKGRIYRQGSEFKDVEIIIPQVRIELDEGEFWSWDIQRLNLIKNKKTLADAAVDGVIPSIILPTRETMFRKSQESLIRWKERINDGNIIETNRCVSSVHLYPEILDINEREKRITSELSEFNRRGKITRSETMNKEFTDNPESWFRYHSLRKERMVQWEEIPYEYISTKIKNKNHKVVDFGCGENLFKNCISNEVISFDHVAYDDSVIACDIKDVSGFLDDESVDVTMFSLALWGTNYKDYMLEAYRVLNYGGVIHIAEPAKYYEIEEDESKLVDLISEVGFKVVGEIEKRGKFIYITGIKM